MSTKEELLIWNDACVAFDAQDYERSLALFDQIADSARIYFNIGVVLADLQEHEAAVKAYDDALKADQHFAVAYFQRGVSNFLLGEFEEAIEDFNGALQHLRGNVIIDYTQLGLAYKLFNCEVLYNRGICHLFMGDDEPGTADLYSAQKEKRSADHDVIDQAIAEGVDGLTVFSIPPGLVFRPPAAKVKNASKVDYLGSPKLIAAVERSDRFTGFKGAYLRKATNVTAAVRMESAPSSTLSRSATAPTSSPIPQRPPADEGGRRGRANSVDSAPVPGPRRSSAAGSQGRKASLASPITVSTTRRTSSSSPRLASSPLYRQAPPTVEFPNRRTTSHRGSIFSGSGDNILHVKCHYSNTLVVVCEQDVAFADLVIKIQQKYNASNPLRLKYKNEKQELVLMTGDDDLDAARSLAGRPDSLDVWCFD